MLFQKPDQMTRYGRVLGIGKTELRHALTRFQVERFVRGDQGKESVQNSLFHIRTIKFAGLGVSNQFSAFTDEGDGFFIFKCTDDEWSMVSNDASSQYHVHYWDDVISTGWSNCSHSTNVDTARTQISFSYGRYSLYSASTNLTNSVGPTEGSQFVYAANPNVYEATASSSYYYTGRRRVFDDLGDGNNVYMLTGYYLGPSFLIDLRS